MKILIFLFFVITTIAACNAQTKKVKVSITNRTSNSIDSIIIPYYPKLSIYTKLDKGANTLITTHFKVETSDYSEGMFNLYVYQNGKQKMAQWGLHDWGQFARETDSIFVYDNGIAYTNKSIEKPIILSIFLIKRGSTDIDEVFLKTGEIKRSKLSNEMLEIQADFSALEKTPYFFLKDKEKSIKVTIEHDWSNWNNNQIILYVFDNGVVSKEDKK